MITNFIGFGPVHLLSLLLPVFVGVIWIVWGLRAKTERQRTLGRLTMAGIVVLVRAARYVMDAYSGVFEWSDLFSLHICHIDLILLVLCLIRPNKAMFNFCFIIGIPMALSVALFPGSNHPAPGLPRAVLFITSHAMLVIGAVYLAVTQNLKPTLRSFFVISVLANLCLIPLYFINASLGTNFLYIMKAPPGTVIASLETLFGWPGYVLALDALALLLMFFMLIFGQLLWKLGRKGKISKKKVYQN